VRQVHGRGARPEGVQAQRQEAWPEDIYLRVTYGYRRMPAWEAVFTDDERMAITAYMKSPRFSN
jgi:Cytochrome C oxidase, cbb3-type, subunit III